MKSLTNSSCCLFAGFFNDDRLSCPEYGPRKQEVRFVRHEGVSNFPLSQYVVSLSSTATRSLSSPSLPSLSLPFNCKAISETGESQTDDSDESKVVRVRFMLQKECLFGEQFLILGDEPILGLWDPSCAVPLDWSNGHVWVCELDLPVGKTIQYKFVLKHLNGSIVWQPDPDRVFQTWETMNVVSVFDDWDNPKLQNIVEEELILDQTKESKCNPYVVPMEEKHKELIVQVMTVNSYEKNPFPNLDTDGDGAMSHSCSEEPVETTSTFIEANLFGPNKDIANLVSYGEDAVQVLGLSSTSRESFDEKPTIKYVDKCITNESPIQEPVIPSCLVDSTDYKNRSSTTNAAIKEDGFKGLDALKEEKSMVKLREETELPKEIVVKTDNSGPSYYNSWIGRILQRFLSSIWDTF